MVGSCYLFFVTGFFIIFFLKIILGFISLSEVRFLDTVSVEPEFLIENSISVVGSLHVFIGEGDWDDEVNIIVVDNVDNQADGYDEASVFKVCKLNVHCTELNSPSNL